MNKPVSNSFDVTKRVGLQIRKFRNEKKMSQLDLAIASEMDENALQRIEVGRTNPTVKTLFKISEALEIELYLLFKFID